MQRRNRRSFRINSLRTLSSRAQRVPARAQLPKLLPQPMKVPKPLPQPVRVQRIVQGVINENSLRGCCEPRETTMPLQAGVGGPCAPKMGRRWPRHGRHCALSLLRVLDPG